METSNFGEEHRTPKIIVEGEDDDLLIYFRLVKSGYAASLREAKEMDVREVIQALHYETFLADYEKAFIEMNRSD